MNVFKEAGIIDTLESGIASTFSSHDETLLDEDETEDPFLDIYPDFD